jgi:transposase
MAIVDGGGLPIAIMSASASPHEVTLVGEKIASRPCDEVRARLVGDRAYDSDTLDAELAERLQVQLIAPHRRGRRRRRTQDGRALRRYRRRWKVERFFAWLGKRPRVVVRWDRHWENTLGWVRLAAILILDCRL